MLMAKRVDCTMVICSQVLYIFHIDERFLGLDGFSEPPRVIEMLL